MFLPYEKKSTYRAGLWLVNIILITHHYSYYSMLDLTISWWFHPLVAPVSMWFFFNNQTNGGLNYFYFYKFNFWFLCSFSFILRSQLLSLSFYFLVIILQSLTKANKTFHQRHIGSPTQSNQGFLTFFLLTN